MPHDLLRNGDGRFWRGNLHCHSNRSDGHWEPERVAAADGDRLAVATSAVHAITLGGPGDRWLDGITVVDENGGPVDHATFDLSAFAGSYCRVTVVDAAGRRAWRNPLWP